MKRLLPVFLFFLLAITLPIQAQETMTLQALDEVTFQDIGFQSDFYLINETTSYLTFTGQRVGDPCLYDEINDTECFGASSGGSTGTAQSSTVQAFDYYSAIFEISWQFDNPDQSGAKSAQVYVRLENGTQLFTQSVSGAPQGRYNNFTSQFTVSNTEKIYPRALNLTINASVTGGVPNPSVSVFEMRLVNTSIGYKYDSTTNNTITIPTTVLNHSITMNTFLRGEELYTNGYTNQRMYRLSIDQQQNYTVNTYLLNDTQGYNQFFIVLDSNNNPIENAIMTLQRWYTGGIARTVVQCESNPAGSCSLFLSPFVVHQLIIQQAAYDTLTNDNVFFTGSPNPANVYLTSSGSGNFTDIFEGLSITFSPTDNYFSNATNATCGIVSSLGNIQFINFTIIKFANLTETVYNNTFINNSVSGATIKQELSENGRYELVCEYKWSSNVTGQTLSYQNEQTNSLWIYFDRLLNSAQYFDQAFGIIIALGITLIVSAYVFYYSNAEYATGTAILFLFMFAYAGFVSWNIVGLTVLTGISLVVLRSWL